jgi:hypothetical protein
MGSPQWHGQRSSYVLPHGIFSGLFEIMAPTTTTTLAIKMGFLPIGLKIIFIKTLMQLQWKWHIAIHRLRLETQVYSSFGTGGGSYESGNTPEGVIYHLIRTWRNLSKWIGYVGQYYCL